MLNHLLAVPKVKSNLCILYNPQWEANKQIDWRILWGIVLVAITFQLRHKIMLNSNVIIKREVQVKKFHQFLKVCISLQQVIKDQSIKQIIQALVNKITVEEVQQMMPLNCNQFLKNKQIEELPH